MKDRISSFYILIFFILFTYNSNGQTEEVDTLRKRFKDLKPISSTTASQLGASPGIFGTADISAYQMIVASIAYSEQSLTVTPTQFSRQPWVEWFEAKIKIGQKDKITTTGVGLTFNLFTPDEKIYKNLASKYTYITECNDDSACLVEAATKFFLEGKYDLIKDYYDYINKFNVRINPGISTQLFPVIGGKAIDKDKDGKKEDFQSIKNFTATLGLNAVVCKNWSAGASLYYAPRRKDALQFTKMAKYAGYSCFLTYRIITFNENLYYKSEDFVKTGFIPGVEVGVSFEELNYIDKTENRVFAEESIKKQYAISPIFDVRITPKSQFRIAFPIKQTIKFSDTDAQPLEFTTLLQYNFLLSTL